MNFSNHSPDGINHPLRLFQWYEVPASLGHDQSAIRDLCRQFDLRFSPGLFSLLSCLFIHSRTALNQSQLFCPRGRLGPVADAKFSTHVVDVGLGCPRADDQFPRDLAVRKPCRHQPEHFEFPFA